MTAFLPTIKSSHIILYFTPREDIAVIWTHACVYSRRSGILIGSDNVHVENKKIFINNVQGNTETDNALYMSRHKVYVCHGLHSGE